MIIQISAGQGSSECQLAVAKLFEALQKQSMVANVRDTVIEVGSNLSKTGSD